MTETLCVLAPDGVALDSALEHKKECVTIMNKIHSQSLHLQRRL